MLEVLVGNTCTDRHAERMLYDGTSTSIERNIDHIVDFIKQSK